MVLAGWIALAVLAVVYMPLARVQAAEAALRGLGASIGQAEGGGRSVSFSQGFDDKSLAEAAAHLHELDDLTSLSPRFTSISDLQPLAGLTNLSTISLRETNVTDVSPVKRPNVTIVGP